MACRNSIGFESNLFQFHMNLPIEKKKTPTMEKICTQPLADSILSIQFEWKNLIVLTFCLIAIKYV